MKRIYISGPMTGLPNCNREAFHATEKRLHQDSRFRDWVIYNPANLPQSAAWTWHDYMRINIAHIIDCQCMYMLPGWQNSKGANLEHHIAEQLGFEIIYQEEPCKNTPALAAADQERLSGTHSPE
jgi:NADH:ubiquinone oxidoreductase subunit